MRRETLAWVALLVVAGCGGTLPTPTATPSVARAPTEAPSATEAVGTGSPSTTASASPSAALTPSATSIAEAPPPPVVTTTPSPPTAAPRPEPTAVSTPPPLPPATPTPVPPTTRATDIRTTAFEVEIVVLVGGSVVWTNRDVAVHTVTSSVSAFDSGFLTEGQSYARTFEAAGSFAYACRVHPSMQATVIVR